MNDANNRGFETAPWKRVAADEIATTRAYTFLEERQLAVWLARDRYRGRGEIVDAGAFLGGSALSFAIGLDRNERVADSEKVGRIHSFDTFEWLPWIRKDFLPPDVEFGKSFLGRYHDTLKKYERSIVIHPGDISTRAWRFGPIEILFVDCAKSFATNAAILRLFFADLLPGGYLVQQDYCCNSRLIWLHATMEFFWKKFEDKGTTRSGASTIFRLVEPITREDIEACIAAMKKDCVGLAERATDRYEPSDRRRAEIIASLASFKSAPLALS